MSCELGPYERTNVRTELDQAAWTVRNALGAARVGMDDFTEWHAAHWPHPHR